MENKYDFVIRMLKELQEDYTEQYPNEVPDMNLVVGIIEFEIKCSFSQQGVKK